MVGDPPLGKKGDTPLGQKGGDTPLGEKGVIPLWTKRGLGEKGVSDSVCAKISVIPPKGPPSSSKEASFSLKGGIAFPLRLKRRPPFRSKWVSNGSNSIRTPLRHQRGSEAPFATKGGQKPPSPPKGVRTPLRHQRGSEAPFATKGGQNPPSPPKGVRTPLRQRIATKGGH